MTHFFIMMCANHKWKSYNIIQYFSSFLYNLYIYTFILYGQQKLNKFSVQNKYIIINISYINSILYIYTM